MLLESIIAAVLTPRKMGWRERKAGQSERDSREREREINKEHTKGKRSYKEMRAKDIWTVEE